MTWRVLPWYANTMPPPYPPSPGNNIVCADASVASCKILFSVIALSIFVTAIFVSAIVPPNVFAPFCGSTVARLAKSTTNST